MSLLLIAFVGIYANSQSAVTTTVAKDGPKIKFESMDVDYGTIDKGSEPFRTVKFTNVGKEPLIIKSATGNCGCTVPTWPRDAIMPGASNEIKIRYSTERLGQINKKVTITTNEAEGENVHVLSVKGLINNTDNAQDAPVKNSTIVTPKK